MPKMSNETYPNGMCAKYAYNAVGEATNLQYVKSASTKRNRCSSAMPVSLRSTAKCSSRPARSQARTTATTPPGGSPKSKKRQPGKAHGPCLRLRRRINR